MPRARPLTLARGFKFQTASHEFSLTFFCALHCSQTEHAHKRLSIPHADTVTETGRQKFTSIATIYECVWERELKLCCYDSYQEKSLLSNITIKIGHQFVVICCREGQITHYVNQQCLTSLYSVIVCCCVQVSA